MERWSRGWQQIGGPNALTKWSWILTLPLALVISNVYAQTPRPTQVVLWLGIALLVHCILGVLMWLARLTVLSHRPRRSRPITAVIVFAALGTVRGLLMQSAQALTGIGGTEFFERMGVNMLGSVVVLAAIAIVVGDFRIDADIKVRLEAANRTLAAVRDQEAATLQAADLDVLSRVRAGVEAALSEAGATSERSRQVSEEIVRPMSHELAEADTLPSFVEATSSSVKTKLSFSEAFAAIAAPSPFAVALLLEVAAFGAVLGRFGPVVAALNFIVGGAAIYLGGSSFRRFVPLPRPLVARILVIALGFAIIGGIGALLIPPLIDSFISPFQVQLQGPMVGCAGSALIVSFGTAIITGRRQRLDEMAAAIAESASSLENLQSRVQERRMRASRFLHGPIQSELVAAAVRGDGPVKVRELIEQRFAEYAQLPSAKPAREQVTDILVAWNSILNIESTIDDAVWPYLNGDSHQLTLLLDALSEGFTNALRHAQSTNVRVRVGMADRCIALEVETDGQIASNSSPGIGLNQLRSRGADVHVFASESSVILRVELDTSRLPSD